MRIDDLEGLYLAELEELRSVKAQMADHLADMAGRATDTALRGAINAQRKQTATQADGLETLLRVSARDVSHHEDGSMQTIIAETEKWNDMIADDTLRDAALVASLRRMQHYRIAVLGTLAKWARTLGQGEDEAVLSRMLEQTETSDSELVMIADDILKPGMP